jgi:methenyltetrahydrofolate cyclohydrolase
VAQNTKSTFPRWNESPGSQTNRSPRLRLADADELAFQAVIDSYKHPSNTEELKSAREASIQAALTQAAQVPAQLIKVAGTVMDLADELDINVVALKAGTARTQLEHQTSRIEEKVITKADSLIERVRKRILS